MPTFSGHPSFPPATWLRVRVGRPRQRLGQHWVFYVDADTGLVQHLPANWTTVVAEDPFVAVSAGRSHFRITDLLELVKIVRDAS